MTEKTLVRANNLFTNQIDGVSKYRSKKITVDGIIYDSKKEYRRHMELLLLEKSGAISDLKRQVKFELIPSQRDISTKKVIERPLAYIADFVYTENGKTVVEDVKGFKRSTAYAVFAIKRKLMLYVHGIRVV